MVLLYSWFEKPADFPVRTGPVGVQFRTTLVPTERRQTAAEKLPEAVPSHGSNGRSRASTLFERKKQQAFQMEPSGFSPVPTDLYWSDSEPVLSVGPVFQTMVVLFFKISS